MRKIMLAAAIAAVGMASGAQAQEKLKFAVFTPDSEMTHQVIMKPWAEKVSKESGGTLEIQTFPNGALGRNPGPADQDAAGRRRRHRMGDPVLHAGRLSRRRCVRAPEHHPELDRGLGGGVAAVEEGHAARLRSVSHDRSVHDVALYDPHQRPDQKAGRSERQKNPRSWRHVNGDRSRRSVRCRRVCR